MRCVPIIERPFYKVHCSLYDSEMRGLVREMIFCFASEEKLDQLDAEVLRREMEADQFIESKGDVSWTIEDNRQIMKILHEGMELSMLEILMGWEFFHGAYERVKWIRYPSEAWAAWEKMKEFLRGKIDESAWNIITRFDDELDREGREFIEAERRRGEEREREWNESQENERREEERRMNQCI